MKQLILKVENSESESFKNCLPDYFVSKNEYGSLRGLIQAAKRQGADECTLANLEEAVEVSVEQIVARYQRASLAEDGTDTEMTEDEVERSIANADRFDLYSDLISKILE